jgi:hypothetical protein
MNGLFKEMLNACNHIFVLCTENVANRNEFDQDIDENAGVYNPVVLPWKDR